MSNSKAELLASMEGRAVTQEWGAISMFSRGRLNRLLEQQFVAGFDEFSFLPSFRIEEVFLNDDETEWMDLQDIILSKPLLSFETASLDNSRATLTLGIISGTVTVSSKPVGKPATLLSSFKLSEQQGFTLSMTVNLAMVVGEVDKRGRVTLDLRNSVQFSCNLAEQLNAQNRLGEVFGRFLKALPRHKRVYELGTLDLKGYNPLTPTTFYIRTQAAPGAKTKAALNYGDGGVLIFIAVRGKPSPEYFPGEGSGFPYLIPDDQDGQGDELYSATLVVSYDLLQYAEQDRLDLLNSLLFPGENVFVESSRHTPQDLIVFGNIDPTQTSITLDPLFKVIRAGTTLQYSVVQAGKKLLKAASVTWSVRSINTVSSAGSISTTGRYTSVGPQQLGKETVRNVITAEYNDPVSGELRRASALVSVAFEGVTVSPQSSVNYLNAVPRPVVFSAATLDGGAQEWSLLEPGLGSLIPSGSNVIYTPPVKLPGDQGFAVQRVQVQDKTSGLKAQASVLLLEVNQALSITPPFVSNTSRSAGVQLTVPDNYPVEMQRWSVFSGDGTVSDSGLFSAPAQITSPVSVVRCEIVIDGMSLLSGYSIIQLSDFTAEASWKDIASFKLTAPADERHALANGFQQIAVDVQIETQPVNGVSYPVTEEEMSSLVIVHRDSKQALDYLPRGLEGIESDAIYTWAVSTEENRFNRYGGGLAQAANKQMYAVDDGITRRRVYVQTRATNPEIFYGRFIDAYFGEHNSNEKNDNPPYHIELIPTTVPVFVATNYIFNPKRVAGGGNNPPQQIDYDYLLTTTDYWVMAFVGGDGRPVRFIRFEFEDNQSTLQWESRRDYETMFSYTGYSFNYANVQGDGEIMRYDERLDTLMPGRVLDKRVISGQEAGEGELMISLFRVDDVNYVPGGADSDARVLEQPLRLRLLDRNGNFHHLSIGFAPMGTDTRNTLLVTTL